jgi:hypothetical protein
MQVPPPSLVRVDAAFARGDLGAVLREADATAVALRRAGVGDAELGRLALLVGASHAAFEHTAEACAYLEFGLEHHASDAGGSAFGPADPASELPPPPRPTLAADAPAAPPSAPPEAPTGGRAPASPTAGGPAPVGPDVPRATAAAFRAQGASAPTPAPVGTGPVTGNPMGGAFFGPPGGATGIPSHQTLAPAPWTAAAKADRNAADPADWADLLLIELYLLLGRYADAQARCPALLEPDRSIDTRFAATRARAVLSAIAADHETAHQHLNTAAGLAARVPSAFRATLVEGDRAVVLATQGRGREAVTLADRAVAKLVSPAVGAYQVWANREAARVAFTVSRLAAIGGDQLAARRLLLFGQEATEAVGGVYLSSLASLTVGVAAGAAGTLDVADAELGRAHLGFEAAGYRPADAIVSLEQARIAYRHELPSSARPMIDHATAEFRSLGLPCELRLVRALVNEHER